MDNILTLPQFCAHEHWGSIESIGMSAEGFRPDTERGATPNRRTGLIDILVDPYFGGCLIWAGTKPDDIAKQAGAEKLYDLPVLKAMEALRPALHTQQLTGAYQCIRRGIKALYSLDIDGDEREITAVDAMIADSYERIFDWYRECMHKSHFNALLRPVHPVFYVRQESQESAAEETAFTRTVMRIDPLLDMWQMRSPDRDELARAVGVEPKDAKSWREFIGKLFDLAAGNGAVGIKQLQAYHRTVGFNAVEDSEVTLRPGDLNIAQVRLFQDWVVHECCRQANDRKWPHQVHIGTHNLPGSSPLALTDLAVRYPEMKIIQLHCWPYIDEAGWLAKHHANIYIDACWLPILNPQFLRQAWQTWLNYIPTHKLMCSNDATSVEMAAGSSLFIRETLTKSLMECTKGFGISDEDLERTAADILHGNAVSVYGVEFQR